MIATNLVYSIAVKHFDKNSEQFAEVVAALNDLADNLYKRVKFVRPEDMVNYTVDVSVVNFDRFSEGKFLQWGQNDGDTVGLVMDKTGRVYQVPPYLIKFEMA